MESLIQQDTKIEKKNKDQIKVIVFTSKSQ